MAFNNYPLGGEMTSGPLRELIQVLNGERGETLDLVGLNSPSAYVIDARQLDTVNGQIMRARKSDGTVLFQVTKNGVVVSPDGGAAVAPVTLTHAQAIQNKTLDNTDNAVVRLADSGVLAAPAASIDIQSISGLYRHLWLEYFLRTDQVANESDLRIRFNNDSGANYAYQNLNASGGLNSTSLFGQTSILATAAITGSTAQAFSYGAGEILLPHYASANHKIVLVRSVNKSAGTTMRLVEVGGQWLAVAVINRITLSPASGNFVAGSQVSLFGVPI